MKRRLPGLVGNSGGHDDTLGETAGIMPQQLRSHGIRFKREYLAIRPNKTTEGSRGEPHVRPDIQNDISFPHQSPGDLDNVAFYPVEKNLAEILDAQSRRNPKSFGQECGSETFSDHLSQHETM